MSTLTSAWGQRKRRSKRLSQLVAETIERMSETQQLKAGMQYLNGPRKSGKVQSLPWVHSGSV